MIARLTRVVLHCHHNRTLIACNCFSAINQMFTVTSHILMMQGQAAPKTSPTGSLAVCWRVPRTGIKATHRHWINKLPFLLDLEGSQCSGQHYSDSWRCRHWERLCTDPSPSVRAHELIRSIVRPCVTLQKYLNDPVRANFCHLSALMFDLIWYC